MICVVCFLASSHFMTLSYLSVVSFCLRNGAIANTGSSQVTAFHKVSVCSFFMLFGMNRDLMSCKVNMVAPVFVWREVCLALDTSPAGRTLGPGVAAFPPEGSGLDFRPCQSCFDAGLQVAAATGSLPAPVLTRQGGRSFTLVTLGNKEEQSTAVCETI